MKYYFALLILGLYMCGCQNREDALTAEAQKLEHQMKEMAFYAPTLKAFEDRVDSIRRIDGKWPINTDQLFKPGPLDVRYTLDGRMQSASWSKENFKIELLKWKAGKPVYKLNFAGLEREMEM